MQFFFLLLVLLYIYFITPHCCHCPSLPFLCNVVFCNRLLFFFFLPSSSTGAPAALICWLCTVVHNATLTSRQFGNRRKVLPRRGRAKIHRLGPPGCPLFHSTRWAAPVAKLGGNFEIFCSFQAVWFGRIDGNRNMRAFKSLIYG